MYVVVCYDISDHRQRARLHELLLGYGTPIQKSVFECQVSAGQFQRLQARTRLYVRKASDSIRYYHLCGRCQQRTQAVGTSLVDIGPRGDYVV